MVDLLIIYLIEKWKIIITPHLVYKLMRIKTDEVDNKIKEMDNKVNQVDNKVNQMDN